MALGYHVFGPALLQVGTGTAKALENFGFGYGEKPITIRPRPRRRNIFSDAGGTDVPAERQKMNTDYLVTGDFVVYDEAVRAKLEALNDAASPAEGKMGTPGILVGTGGYYFPLAIVPQGSPTSMNPFYFPVADIEDMQEIHVGTPNSVFRISFYAWPFLSATALTAKGVVAMQRVVA